MYKKIVSLALASVMALSVMLTGCGAKKEDTTTTSGTKKPVVGFIYVGPIGDGGYTYSHNEGAKAIEKELGIKPLIRESVPENAEVEKVIKEMVDQNANIIFGTSFGYMPYMEKMAKQFPKVKFMHCSGNLTADNMSNYFGRIEEARYLSGIVAGLKTKSNKIGYVAAFDIPEVVRGINAFTLGAQSVNPKVEVQVTWTNTWYDPAKEKEAAKALLADGADIIAQHQDTTGPQIAAEEKGAFAIGYNTDSKSAAPKAYLTAPIWNWGPYYVATVKSVMDGTWKKESYWEGMKSGVVDLAPMTDLVPAEAKTKVEDVKKKILDGSFNVFQGPIKDQSGAVKVQAGQKMSDKDQLELQWFVQGVKGKIGK